MSIVYIYSDIVRSIYVQYLTSMHFAFKSYFTIPYFLFLLEYLLVLEFKINVLFPFKGNISGTF